MRKSIVSFVFFVYAIIMIACIWVYHALVKVKESASRMPRVPLTIGREHRREGVSFFFLARSSC